MSATARWSLLGMLVLVSMSYAITGFGFVEYVQSWGGAMFKSMSGGCLGFCFSRWLNKVDVSTWPAELRPIAGLSPALLIAGGMIGVPCGS